ncbi:MAG: leucyl/phenylalanyl-tRNA--protein transferase [Burkholderiales bacterium]|nr:leucyl/phenylalanyl-tRNA--protein transferase [Burkholderiales bacterium]
MVPWIETPRDFPPVAAALTEPNGLLCVGADLAPETIIAAYSRGIFPWFSDGQPILWWSPDPRMVLFPSEFKRSKSLAKTINRDIFEIRVDTAFVEVIAACSAPRQQGGGTWIVPEMQAAYVRLHALGVAHSIESWRDGKLVGGLYGLAMGRMFFGESMFATETNASKVALVALVDKLQRDGFELIDCQQETRHLASFGARPIARQDFVQRLKELINLSASGSVWCSS